MVPGRRAGMPTWSWFAAFARAATGIARTRRRQPWTTSLRSPLRGRSVGRNEALASRLAQGVDLLAARADERHGALELRSQPGVRERQTPFGHQPIERRDDRLLDLGPAEALGLPRQRLEVEALWLLLAQPQMNREDLTAGRRVRQVDEEDLVEPALAQQLRRNRVDVVGGGDDEDGSLALLHPGEERAEQPPPEAGVGLGRAARGEDLLDLVDPQNDGSQGFRRFKGVAQVSLGLSDVLVEQASRVEAGERHPP